VQNQSLGKSKDELIRYKYYRVQIGDSMLKIAYMFNASMPLIKKINDLISDDVYPGQILKIIDNNPENESLLIGEEELSLQQSLKEESIHKSYGDLESSDLLG